MSTAATERRRVRSARSALNRVQQQREQFVTGYGAAATAAQRFNAAATALRAAVAARKQHRPQEVAGQLDAVTDQIVGLLEELHTAQQHQAEHTLRADARRLARQERRHTDDSDTRAGRSGTAAA